VDDQAAHNLSGLLHRAFDSARWIVEGLTDDEYFWEPVEGCWSVRERTGADWWWGTGTWQCEDGLFPDPVPVTTIAWRLAHLTGWTEVYRDHTFHDGQLSLQDLEVPGTADGAVAWLAAAQEAFAADVDAMTDADLVAIGRHWSGEARALQLLVREIAVEHLHHGAEIGVLRDLKAGHARRQPLPELYE
jgi:hypothetical protein